MNGMKPCQCLPLRGAFPLRWRTPKPLLEERWHAKRDGEVCRRAAAAARKRPDAQADALREVFGAVTPLSQPAADSSPQGEPLSQASGPVRSASLGISIIVAYPGRKVHKRFVNFTPDIPGNIAKNH